MELDVNGTRPEKENIFATLRDSIKRAGKGGGSLSSMIVIVGHDSLLDSKDVEYDGDNGQVDLNLDALDVIGVAHSEDSNEMVHLILTESCSHNYRLAYRALCLAQTLPNFLSLITCPTK